ncbi:hypothetical protein [Teredinibacter sp. KSP-S5-2]|uniref:immunity protein Imm33 domain-containing protein n=1 Tax=Teredinibacter sp. KSP-S5-2 TaxID=3034506 RepID=UPI0029343AFC|nr:hypothetical protein [Teredinibacter sp. KSP-S5-2]WNO10388.1 hypothetical protein P5V12_04315 [Teredinibacter sp. KSP-S5-2]
MKTSAIEELQRELCKKYESDFLSSPNNFKVGIASNIRDGIVPINGLRHPPEGDTTGWYIYAGEELSDDPNFFKPLHVEHLDDWCPQVKKYLGLAPGWRFLIAGDYEDVWFDDSLLKV